MTIRRFGLSDKQVCELYYWSLPRAERARYAGSPGQPRTIDSLERRGLLIAGADGMAVPSTEGWRLLLALAEAGNPPWRT